MRPFCLVLFILLGSVFSMPAQHADCSSAFLWADSLVSFPRPGMGFGKTLELKQAKSFDSTAFKKETQSIWLKFSVSQKSDFTFELTPSDIRDDYDFMFFSAGDSVDCSRFDSLSKVVVLRTNISRNDPALGSRTGIMPEAPVERAKIGVGSSFSRMVALDPGHYVLVVSCPKPPRGGFSLSRQIIPHPEPPDPIKLWMDEQKRLTRNQLLFSVVSMDSLRPIKASVSVRYLSESRDVILMDSSSYRLPLSGSVLLTAVVPGFEPCFLKVAPAADSSRVVDTLFLRPLRKDSTFSFSQIYFEGNTAVFLPGSEVALQALVLLMDSNPSLKIEIQGHVNGPNSKNTREFKRLSQDRAREIRDFLLANGIRKNRADAEGYGNTKMIYSNPQNPEEGEKNRRVEIKILDLN